MDKKKNILLTIMAILMFLIGGLIFFYPTISNYMANKHFESLISDYEVRNQEIKEDDLKDEYNKAVEYNNALVGDPVYDPFVPGSGYALPDNYEDVLNINGDGIMGFIEIPKIAVKIPIYHGSSEKVLEKGIGHLEMSALPIGGIGNNPILTGHRGLPRAELFTRLDELKNKDKIYIHVLNDILAYEVDKIVTILPDELSKLEAYRDQDNITLITCTPYGVNTHRLVVQAHRVEYIPEEKEKIKSSKVVRLSESFGIRIVGTILGVVVLIILLYLFNKRRDKQNNKETAMDTNIMKDVESTISDDAKEEKTKPNIPEKVGESSNNHISNKPKKNYKKKKRRKYENKN